MSDVEAAKVAIATMQRCADPDKNAEAFIAALPEGWVLWHPSTQPEAFAEDLVDYGAQQERERLRTEVARIRPRHSRFPPNWTATEWADWLDVLLADPEPIAFVCDADDPPPPDAELEEAR